MNSIFKSDKFELISLQRYSNSYSSYIWKVIYSAFLAAIIAGLLFSLLLLFYKLSIEAIVDGMLFGLILSILLNIFLFVLDSIFRIGYYLKKRRLFWGSKHRAILIVRGEYDNIYCSFLKSLQQVKNFIVEETTIQDKQLKARSKSIFNPIGNSIFIKFNTLTGNKIKIDILSEPPTRFTLYDYNESVKHIDMILKGVG
jgi:hypothetical protein